MPNTFAYAVLMFFPLISIVLYIRCNTLTATFWTIVGGYMFLPVKVVFDFPLVPPLGQQTIPALCAIFGCSTIKRHSIQFIPRQRFEKAIVFILLFSPVLTVLTNMQPYFNGESVKPGMSVQDIISSIVQAYLEIIPFLIGLSLVSKRENYLHFLKLMVVAGLIYSPLVLFEIRFSPQLHSAIYGFFPHEFKQQIRLDGFRPVVFMGHGLLVSIFYVAVFLCSVQLARLRSKVLEQPALIFATYFLVVLILCKSVGAWILSLAGLTILCCGQKVVVKFALTLAIIVLIYPLLSMFDIFPHEKLLSLLSIFGEERVASLDFRFFNESMLLEHTRDQFLFGWGGWGRNRPIGVVTDGYWVIRLSESGIVGFLGTFLLILSPVIRGRRRFHQATQVGELDSLAFTMLFTALLAVNQIPNSSMYSWLWFSIGVMGGYAGSRSARNIKITNARSSHKHGQTLYEQNTE
ncbi:hypothetical protein ACNKU7_10275 [Microbulbifer sp. SA54]|uniref:hypothetical protein n=1 Tax=Microbulbifer sp. SA54 TaxID=3401577 RepID=UPI003AB07568